MTSFLVDSKFRIDQTSPHTDFSIKLDIHPNLNYSRILCAQILVPTTYYQVTNNNNRFTLIEDGIPYPLALPVGNYTNINALKTTLQTLLNDSGLNTYSVTSPDTSIEADTHKLTISYTGVLPASLVVDSIRIGELFGLTLKTHPFVPIAGGGRLISDRAYTLSVEQTLVLYSNGVEGNTPLMVCIDNGIGGGTLTRSCLDYDKDSRPLRMNRSNVFHFVLRNEDDDLIDTNGGNISLEIILF